ncbi:arsenic resistance protein [Alteribacter natronophilus]|uniref:arsenic resistance protein n=1 Tax=Alteribacter natronophilus TaxID=2583810 RepID=UPI00110E365D|nr:bile acid:sodium symporter [Alteribacter natronophilus]TMW70355.1 arsenic resistance protein [Alteribacter natronophilus]
MKRCEKLYSLIILISVIAGLLFGMSEPLRESAGSLIVPLLIVMLYVTFLQIRFSDLMDAFKNRKFTVIAILINFIWVPLLAAGLGYLFLGSHPALFIGFIMLMVTPCTDWYLIFTGIARGNVALAAAILPVNLLLQVVLLPLYLLIFAGSSGTVEPAWLLESVILVLLVPLGIAMLTKGLLKNKRGLEEKLLTRIGALPVIFLSLAITAMFTSQGEVLLTNLEMVVLLLIPIVLFFVINYLAGQFAGRLAGFSYRDRVSLSLTTLARNSPLALAIAMTAFPGEPLIALTLVIGPLLELPVLAAVSHILLKGRKKAD